MTVLCLNLVHKVQTNISDKPLKVEYIATFFTFYWYNLAEVAIEYYLCRPLKNASDK